MAFETTDSNSWMILTYCISLPVMVFFALFAGLYTKFYGSKVEIKAVDATEGFITARKTQGMWRVGWSFFAGSVGAWVITGPSSYASYAGALGLAFYAFASGMPLIVIAYFGQAVQDRFPTVCSVSDFALARYGPTAKIMVTMLTLFNMSIAMLAEYTTIGSIFKDFVGSVNYGIIIAVAVLTSAYTIYGGLMVSIVTDQAQAIATVLMVLVVTIYVAASYRPAAGLPPDFGDYKPYLGPNEFGYSAIFVMPMSLLSATVFSEAMWQRVWASESADAVHRGGVIGCVATVVVVFLSGFAGLLAVWGGVVDWDPASPTYTNPNLLLFQVFKDAGSLGQATVSSWIGVFVVVLAVIMNESALDSFQNGLAATLTAHFLKGRPLIFARLMVLVINVPIVAFALDNRNVLSLFLVTNMACTCCTVPLMLGLWSSPLGRSIVTESAVVFACVAAIFTVLAYGIGHLWDAADTSGSVANGAYFAWIGNMYLWDYFLVALGSSCAALLLWIAVAQALKRGLGFEGVGISAILRRVPGFSLLADDRLVPAAAAAAPTPGKLASASEGDQQHDGKRAGAEGVEGPAAAADLAAVSFLVQGHAMPALHVGGAEGGHPEPTPAHLYPPLELDGREIIGRV